MTRNWIYSAIPVAFTLLLFSSCSEEMIGPVDSTGNVAFSAHKVERVELTRAGMDNGFATGTKYRLWIFKDNAGALGEEVDLSASEKYGTETESDYIRLAPADEKKVKGKIHIYGLTNGLVRDGQGVKLRRYHETATPPFQRVIRHRGADPDYPYSPNSDYYVDVTRGELFYDSEAEAYKDASYVVIPFTHILSQVKLYVVQQGEEHREMVTNPETGQLEDKIDLTSRYDINLRKVELLDCFSAADYDPISNTYSNLGHLLGDNASDDIAGKDLRDPDFDETVVGTTQDVRTIWEKNTGENIPIWTDDNIHSLPSVQTMMRGLLLPQTPDAAHPIKLSLTIGGADALKFVNDANRGENANAVDNGDGTVTVTLPLLDPTATGTNKSLEFKPNYCYNLVVTFLGNDVQIVTVIPKIYPFFDGEGAPADPPGSGYQIQDVGIPSVFANLQWNDRYVGAEIFNPKAYNSIDAFVKSTGFYYQKDRTIPYFPTEYVDYDLKKYGELQANPEHKDPTRAPVIEDDNYQINGNDITGKRTWLPDEGMLTYFKTNGHWQDVAPEQFFNKPRVKPVVSYYLPPQQMLACTDNAHPDFDANTFYGDRYAYDPGNNVYCLTVDEYQTADGKVNTYTKGGQKYQKLMRYISNMRNSPSYLWRDHPDKQPCPPGWRLPTRQEFFTIFPSTAVAGNLTFLRSFYVSGGTLGEGDAPAYDDDVREIYVHIPLDAEHPDCVPPRNTFKETYNHATMKDEVFPDFDPEPGDKTEYVISKREFTEAEWNSLSDDERNRVPGASLADKKAKYLSYHQFVKGNIDKPINKQYKGNLPDRVWGVIYAIKKVGTAEAYRMRWRVERIVDGRDAYQIVVEQYKATETQRLLYMHEDMDDANYFLNYNWEDPDNVLYFPITGIVGENNQTYWSNGEYGSAIYNYGTETTILSQDYVIRGTDIYQASYRLKIAGSDRNCQYLYPSANYLAIGGQVRPVRTYRE